MERFIQFFLPISIWFQDTPAWITSFFQAVTFLGNTEFYLIIMPALYWCIDTVLGIRIGIMLLVSGGLNSILKFGFKWPRPFWVTPQVTNFAEGSGFGFPSGHAQNAASVWGLLAASTKKKGLRWIAGAAIILIGFSRMVLGVHFTHDVLAGWLVGLILLGLFLVLEERVVAWFVNKPFLIQIAALILATSLFILPAVLLVPPFNPPAIPESWIAGAGQSINPYQYDGLLTTAGSFLGLGLGILILHQTGMISAGGEIWKRALRYPVGLIGVLILYLGLGSIFPDETDLISYTLRFLRYFLIGFWIAYGAPKIFCWLKLSQTQTS